MKIQLIRLLSSIIAGIIVMILHEFPKAVIYNRLSPYQDLKRKKNIFKLHHYIDPIGILLCITNQAGFSKPYMYRIKDKKTNMILGITGLASLIATFVISIIILRLGFHLDSSLLIQNMSMVELILQFVVVYIALISISMFFVNLFPVSTFDMGLCIAGVSPKKYYLIIKNDYFIKMMLVLIILFEFIKSISTLILSGLL
jgi:hypothetical protein